MGGVCVGRGVAALFGLKLHENEVKEAKEEGENRESESLGSKGDFRRAAEYVPSEKLPVGSLKTS